MKFKISYDARCLRLEKDGRGYSWMCSECYWERPSPPDETDESHRQTMREFNQHICAEYAALWTEFSNVAVR
jgi:hypothetical protein